MSLSIDPKNGIKLKTVRHHGWGFAVAIIILESIFSFFLYMSLAEKVFVVTPAAALSPIPNLISYQGMLTDTSGNPLGGAGAVYCFQYSIWDTVSGGTTSTDQLWPSPAIGNASLTPTVSTTTVVDGVFSDQLGRVDSLGGLDFETATTYYLQVAVNTVPATCTGTWEYLTPRQQIVSDAWSQAAESVDGNLLRTVYTSTSTGMVYLGAGTGTVQIGTGLGTGWEQETLLSLDHVNASGSLSEYFGEACNQDGTLWYDSNLKRAMVCENGTMDMISNATSTLAGIGANASTPITAGDVVFSNANNVSFGQVGSTITASADVAGATPITFLTYQNRQLGASSAIAPGQNSVWLAPFRVIGGVVSASTIAFGELFSGNTSSAVSGQWAQTVRWAIYSNNATNNSTSMNTWASGSFTEILYHSGTSTFSYNFSGATGSSAGSGLAASITGLRLINIPLNSSIVPGLYAWGYVISTSTAGVSNFMNSSGVIVDNPLASGMGTIPGATAASIGIVDGGIWTVTSSAMPSTVALTDIRQVSNEMPFFKAGAL